MIVVVVVESFRACGRCVAVHRVGREGAPIAVLFGCCRRRLL